MLRVFIGSYTAADSPGVHQAALQADGRLHPVGAIIAGLNPSYLLADAAHARIHAVNEHTESEGAIVTIAIAPDGSMQLCARQGSGGSAPCHLCLLQPGLLLVCNYGGGCLSLHALHAEGNVGPALQHLTHAGHGPTARQLGPHPHSAIQDPENGQILVADLGTDHLVAYTLSLGNKHSGLTHVSNFRLPAGSGPRHLCFDRHGKHLYITNELSSTVCVWRREGNTFLPLQEISTLPEDFPNESTCAHLQFSADGRFLYVSNRGHDSLAIFATNADGTLTLLKHTNTGGRTPRHFSLTPDGNFMLVANQDSNCVTVFRVDAVSGELQLTPDRLQIPSPTCIAFLP